MPNEYWLKDEVISNLWNEYSKSDSYKQLGYIPQAIPKNHKIVVEREQRGLIRVFGVLKKALLNKKQVYKDELVSRKASDWLVEWSNFHDLLFKDVLMKDKRSFLRNIDVRIGHPADEEYYDIPNTEKLRAKLMVFADDLCFLMRNDYTTVDEILEFISIVHHKFICIHPFPDGNGRIGRVIIDQLCLAYGMPMVMGTYPRTNRKQREAYHFAIRSASVENDYSYLKNWLNQRIEAQLIA